MKKGVITASKSGSMPSRPQATKKKAASTDVPATPADAIPTQGVVEPTPRFTRMLADEIVKNLTQLGKLTVPFQRKKSTEKKKDTAEADEFSVLVDTSILIDGRIISIVNSGFFRGTLLIPEFVLGEVQHIADSADALRRAKGRRGLDVVTKLKAQKVNPLAKLKVIKDDAEEIKEVDAKLVALGRKMKVRLMTVDFNLAQVARATGVKVLNVNDLSQALKVALMPGEQVTIKITHEGKERQQGVGYLADGTMVVVEDTRDRLGQNITATITKVHQTPAGQLFFARLM